MEQLVERKRLGCRDMYVDWKNSRKTEIFLNSPKSAMLKVSIPNTYQMVDIRKSTYIGFFRFSKINCGNNFIEAVVSGKIQLELFDTVSCYQIDFTHHQIDALKSAVIVQFHLKDVINNDLPATQFKKFMNKDEFYLYVSGVYEIDMEKKDPQHCLESARLGVSVDDGKNGTVDHTECAVLDL